MMKSDGRREKEDREAKFSLINVLSLFSKFSFSSTWFVGGRVDLLAPKAMTFITFILHYYLRSIVK